MSCYYKTDIKKVHSDCFPHNFNALIIGQSGAGKTALLMRLLLEDDLLNYDKLYIYAKSLYQPEYKVLKAGLKNSFQKSQIKSLMNIDEYLKNNEYSLEDLDQIFEGLAEKNKLPPCCIDYEFSEDPSDIPDPRDLDKSIRNLIIFDDVMCDKKQTTEENYYTRGRSANCDCIYLSQNYTHLPLHTARSNSNFMIFFKSSPMVVAQLYRNFASVDMSIDEWKQFCKDAWSKKYGFVVIDMSRDDNNKYRKQLELNKDIVKCNT